MIKKTALSLIEWLIPGKAPKINSQQLKQVDREALHILERLKKAGHESYLVGGCVRDLLLGKKPKDFDIATRASPQQVKSLIHRSFIIGRRFRIVVAKRRPDPVPSDLKNHPFLSHAPRAKEKEFQITTFRRAPVVHDGQINENVFGEPFEDAQRRDFTINGLFLDTEKLKVVDFVGGLPDLKSKTLRMIGDPELRFKEDPIRILRALRFLHRAKLKWESKTYEALKKTVPSIGLSKKERIREEILKMLREGTAFEVFRDIDNFEIWPHVSADLPKFYQHKSARDLQNELIQALAKFPWPDEMDTAPLFFLILVPGFLHHSDHFPSRVPHGLESIMNDLKISKKEKEALERILSTLSKIKRDHHCRHPEKIFIKNHKIFENLNRSFFILKLFSLTRDPNYSDLYQYWEKEWIHYSEQMKKHPHRQHHHHHRSHHGHGSQGGGGSSGHGQGGHGGHSPHPKRH